MKLKKLSIFAAVAAAAVLAVFPVQASSVINAVPQTTQAESGAAAKNAVTYFGSEVLEAYTYNPQKYTYHKITDAKQISLLIKLLESGKTKAPKGAKEGGFLLVTKNGKHEIYIDSQEKELLTLCKNNNAASPGLVQWLVFMSADKIDDIKFESEQGSDSWAFWTGEDQAVLQASSILKGIRADNSAETKVERDADGGSPNTGDYSVCSIRFNTEVSYRMELRRTKLSIYSSDKSFALHYQLPKGEYDRIIREMRQVYDNKPIPVLSAPLNVKLEEVERISVSLDWDMEYFGYSGKNPERIKKVCEILQSSKIYLTGEHIIYAGPDGNPNTDAYNGFEVSIQYKDGSEGWLMRDRNGRLDVFGRGESYNGYAFYQVDHQEIWEKLRQAIK